MAKMSYQSEFVKCGKSTCKKCPHGPYWYVYWREGNKVRKKYIGKNLPEDADKPQGAKSNHRWDAIFDSAKATVALAAEILGFMNGCTLQEARAAFWKLAREHHPDLGGDSTFLRHYNAAWEKIRNHYAWEESGLA